jgi:hypothetical protein
MTTGSLRCTSCGIETEAKCSCGTTYAYIPAREAAALAVAAHPDWSDRKLAKATGVSDTTILRARSGASNEAPAKRVGLDGRKQAARKTLLVVVSKSKPLIDYVPAPSHVEHKSIPTVSEDVLRELEEKERAAAFSCDLLLRLLLHNDQV